METMPSSGSAQLRPVNCLQAVCRHYAFRVLLTVAQGRFHRFRAGDRRRYLVGDDGTKVDELRDVDKLDAYVRDGVLGGMVRVGGIDRGQGDPRESASRFQVVRV